MKKQLVIVLVLLAALMTAGCMNRGGEDAAEPTSTPSYMPQGSSAATAMPGATMGTDTAFDWTANAARIEAQIAQISEIREARVVTTGDTALVGVYFDPSYRGEMTERIREMIASEIKQADANIKTVAVTAEDDDVEDIFEMSDRVHRGGLMAELEEDIREIVREVTTLR